MIPPRNFSLLSNRLAKAGGRRLPEVVLERDYCLAWFLVALSRSPLGGRLAFKGGTALKRCYFGDYRFSEDLDFTLLGETTGDDIRRELGSVFAEAKRATGAVFRFAREDRHPHQNSHTFYLGYEGPLPAPAEGRQVKVDITIKEQLVFSLEDRPVLRAYEEYTDLPEDAKLRTYSLGEIAVEKAVALMDRARNEPRDLYDIWYLIAGSHVQLAGMTGAIEGKLNFRGKTIGEVRGEFVAKKPRFERLWGPRLSGQVVALPEFDGVFRSVHRAFRQAGLTGK